MSGDDKARMLDKLHGDFVEAAARRKAATLPLAKGRKNGGVEAMASWLASKEGRKDVKAALAALKSERQTLKALAKFSRRMLNDKKKSNAETESATVTPAQVEAARPVAPKRPSRPASRKRSEATAESTRAMGRRSGTRKIASPAVR